MDLGASRRRTGMGWIPGYSRYGIQQGEEKDPVEDLKTDDSGYHLFPLWPSDSTVPARSRKTI